MDDASKNNSDIKTSDVKLRTSSTRLSMKYIIFGSVSMGLLLILSIALGMSIKGFTQLQISGIKTNVPIVNTQKIDKQPLPLMTQDKKNTTETKTNSSGNPTTAASQSVSTYQVSQMKNYCSLLSSYISSAESARGQVSEEDLNKLLDSYNRQKVFCDTLISRIGDKNTITKDDDAMWESISKLSYESSALFYKIFGR